MRLTALIIYLSIAFISFRCFADPIRVTRVIDGDTFVTEDGERVRLIGINAPEISDLYGQEAKIHLMQLVQGKLVDLQPDHISKGRDVYSRLLRYVYLSGEDINLKMIKDGFAFAYLKYQFDRHDQYKDAQIIAQSSFNGMWKAPNPSANDKSPTTDHPDEMTINYKELFLVALIVILVVMGIYYSFKR